MSPAAVRAALAAAVFFVCAASARAGFADWSYNWGGSPFAVPANGGDRLGAVNLILPGDGASSPPVAPVGLRAFTALANGADRYDDAAYSLTFTVSDPDSGQSHVVTVHGQFDGTVTSDQVRLSNTFTGGSGTQTFDFLGNDFTVIFGFTASDAAPRSWAGDVTASVQEVSDLTPGVQPSTPVAGPAVAPEPTTLILTGLALPVIGMAVRRWRGR